MDCGIFLNRFALKAKEEIVRRWLVAFIIIALIALVAGYYTFGGADMGR